MCYSNGAFSVLARYTWTKVTASSPGEKNETVYNFEVEDDHNYFVGAIGLLVHNVGPCDILALGKTEGLEAFASSQNPETYISLRLPNELSAVTDITADSDVQVVVQLADHTGNVAYEVGMVQSGDSSIAPSAFEQELQAIAENPNWWSRITWFQGTVRVPNPFE
jgi:hypothetical protein